MLPLVLHRLQESDAQPTRLVDQFERANRLLRIMTSYGLRPDIATIMTERLVVLRQVRQFL
jgi:hypothetical protein